MSLTERMKRFVQEYVIDLDAKNAAIRAGYSAKSAKTKGCLMLKDPRIKEAIDARLKEIADRANMKQEDVFRELVKIARADMSTFAKWGPDGVTLLDSKDLRPEDTAAVAEISQTVTRDGGTKRIRLHDKIKALEMLSRYFGMFTDTPKEDLTINVNIEGLGEVTKKHEG